MENSNKKCELLLLPTGGGISHVGRDEKAVLWRENWEDGQLYHDKYTHGKQSRVERYSDSISNDLYVLSNEDIGIGDYYWDTRSIVKRTKMDFVLYISRKVIASTDKSLGLPDIPNDFIDEYVSKFNVGENIEYADVLYEKVNLAEDANKSDKSVLSNCYNVVERPKVNENDNTLTIKLFKDSWSRREVITLIQKYRLHAALKDNLDLPTCNQFIEKNL